MITIDILFSISMLFTIRASRDFLLMLPTLRLPVADDCL